MAGAIMLSSTYGCGGKTAGDTGTSATSGDDTSISMSASPSRANPRERVVISWQSHNATSVSDSNFGADRVSGSMELNPTVDTVYSIKVYGSGGYATASAQILVNASTEQYLIVGSAGDPQVTGIRDMLATLTTVPVQIQADVPNPGGSYAAVIIHQSGTFGPADGARVKAILDAGKGVVILGRAANKLANGNPNDENTSAIGSWFGGSTFVGYGGNEQIISQEGWLSVPRTIWSGYIYNDYSAAANLIPSAQIVAGKNSTASAFAFRPGSGGRLYFQSHPYGSGNSQVPTSTLFKAGARWAASN